MPPVLASKIDTGLIPAAVRPVHKSFVCQQEKDSDSGAQQLPVVQVRATLKERTRSCSSIADGEARQAAASPPHRQGSTTRFYKRHLYRTEVNLVLNFPWTEFHVS